MGGVSSGKDQRRSVVSVANNSLSLSLSLSHIFPGDAKSAVSYPQAGVLRCSGARCRVNLRTLRAPAKSEYVAPDDVNVDTLASLLAIPLQPRLVHH